MRRGSLPKTSTFPQKGKSYYLREGSQYPGVCWAVSCQLQSQRRSRSRSKWIAFRSRDATRESEIIFEKGKWRSLCEQINNCLSPTNCLERLECSIQRENYQRKYLISRSIYSEPPKKRRYTFDRRYLVVANNQRDGSRFVSFADGLTDWTLSHRSRIEIELWFKYFLPCSDRSDRNLFYQRHERWYF